LGLIGAWANVYPSAGLNTTGTTIASALNTIEFPADGSSIIPVLVQSHNGTTFICGFYSQAFSDLHYFAILVIPTDRRSINNNSNSVTPVVVWSANWNRPTGYLAILKLTIEGDLTLKDGDSSVMWSTQTYGKSVVGMNLTDTGNLVLFDKNNAAVWQSFDHPTDMLLLGQKLRFIFAFSDY